MTDFYSDYLQQLEELTFEEIENFVDVIRKDFICFKPLPKISKRSSLETRKAKLIDYILNYFGSVGSVNRDSYFLLALKKSKNKQQ